MKQIIVKCENKEEMHKVRDSIHRQLAGSKDYVDSNVILNTDEDRNDGTSNEVHVYIMDECKIKPRIILV